jgi:hypothetical protein
MGAGVRVGTTERKEKREKRKEKRERRKEKGEKRRYLANM